MQKRRPDFFHVFFYEQHFQRYLTAKYNRGAPWWFYIAVLPAGLLPWTAPFLAGLWRAARKPFGPDYRGPALAAWTLGVAAFFSTSHSKLATYVLPVFPHACLLAVSAIDEGLPEWAARLQRVLGILLSIAAVVAGAAFTFHLLPSRVWPPPGLPAESAPGLALLLVILLGALGASQWIAPSAKSPAKILALGGLVAGLCLFLGLRRAAPLVSTRDVGLAVFNEARPGDAVWTYDTYLHGLPFYSQRPVDKILQFTGEFHYAKRDPVYAARFGEEPDLRTLPLIGRRTFVAMKTRERERFLTALGEGAASVESSRNFGPWSLIVLRPRAR